MAEFGSLFVLYWLYFHTLGHTDSLTCQPGILANLYIIIATFFASFLIKKKTDNSNNMLLFFILKKIQHFELLLHAFQTHKKNTVNLIILMPAVIWPLY